MARYYVNDNAQSDSGDHEVHVAGCVWLPLIKSKTYLGDYLYCSTAVTKAKEISLNQTGALPALPFVIPHRRSHNLAPLFDRLRRLRQNEE